MKKTIKLSLLCVAAATLAACSPFSSNPSGVDYRSAERADPLAVPPDLTRISSESRYNMPDSARAFEQRQQGNRGTDAATAVSSAGDVHIASQGNQQWLVVKRSPEQLWEPVRSFWENNGFVLSSADRRVGVMETDWAENRANIPLDPIRRILGKTLDSLYSTSQLDRYRTRLERNADGTTSIFITQRGMREVLTGRDKESSTWVDRPNDPGLESEMMRRMMVALGVPEAQAAKMSPQQPAAQQAKTVTTNGTAASNAMPAGSTIAMNVGMDTAWMRTGVALDRAGFTVEERNRNANQYVVRYVPPTENLPRPGLLSKLMGKKDPKPTLTRYIVQLQPASAASTNLRVLDTQGQVATTTDSQRILNVLATELAR